MRDRIKYSLIWRATSTTILEKVLPVLKVYKERVTRLRGRMEYRANLAIEGKGVTQKAHCLGEMFEIP